VTLIDEGNCQKDGEITYY